MQSAKAVIHGFHKVLLISLMLEKTQGTHTLSGPNVVLALPHPEHLSGWVYWLLVSIGFQSLTEKGNLSLLKKKKNQQDASHLSFESLMDFIPQILIKKCYSYTAAYGGRDGQSSVCGLRQSRRDEKSSTRSNGSTEEFLFWFPKEKWWFLLRSLFTEEAKMSTLLLLVPEKQHVSLVCAVSETAFTRACSFIVSGSNSGIGGFVLVFIPERYVFMWLSYWPWTCQWLLSLQHQECLMRWIQQEMAKGARWLSLLFDPTSSCGWEAMELFQDWERWGIAVVGYGSCTRREVESMQLVLAEQLEKHFS